MMQTLIKVERADKLQPEHTSKLARRSFGKENPDLSAERFAWTYRFGFEKSVCVAAFQNDC